MCTEDRALLNDSEFQAIKESDLSVLIAPYLIIGLVIVSDVASDTIRQDAEKRRSES